MRVIQGIIISSATLAAVSAVALSAFVIVGLSYIGA